MYQNHDKLTRLTIDRDGIYYKFFVFMYFMFVILTFKVTYWEHEYTYEFSLVMITMFVTHLLKSCIIFRRKSREIEEYHTIMSIKHIHEL